MPKRTTGRAIERAVQRVQGDAYGEIRNGYPPGVYLPRNPGRRTRLLQRLGLLPWDGNTEDEDSAKEDRR
jgi:hypothetical protein